LWQGIIPKFASVNLPAYAASLKNEDDCPHLLDLFINTFIIALYGPILIGLNFKIVLTIALNSARWGEQNSI
jgi:hypothetical protein